jgi:outer membrane protein
MSTSSLVRLSRVRISTRALLMCLLLYSNGALAQSPPSSPNRPWHAQAEEKVEADAKHLRDARFGIDPQKTYSLAELVDLAEEHNPETRVAWEHARASAAAVGIAHSELYPTLTALVLSQTARVEILFGNQFVRQTLQDFQANLDLSYTIFDFGARSGRINAAKADLLASNFAFNDTHRNVIYRVQEAYYRLLNAIGQEDAARASLANAQAVQQAAEDRLTNGLATLPDVLEARSATAQSDYALQAVLGTEEIARGDLANAIGTSATTLIHVQPLDQLTMPDSIDESVEQAIDRALEHRPDLLQQVAQIRSANARIKEERADYYPKLTVDASPAPQYWFGLQQPNPWAQTGDLGGTLTFQLQWTLFDGGARKGRVAQARADARAAEAQVDATLDQVADEVWTAYSNLNTAFRQRQASLAFLDAANQSYSAALESYNYGVRSLLDVTQAQQTLAQARSADVFARTQVFTAFADLAFRTADSIQPGTTGHSP